MRHVVVMWRSSECDLYCVSTAIREKPPFTRFDRTKSIIRYAPPNGTAGFARSAVRGIRRLPSPPASTIPRTLGPSLTCNTLDNANSLKPCEQRF